MSKADSMRWTAVTLAGMIAVGIAVWVGLQQRPAPESTTVAEPVDHARQECARRLADVGRALSMYAADCDGVYPVTTNPAAAYGEFLPAIAPYGVVEEQLLCPISEQTDGPPYVYHSYLGLGELQWPRWMEAERTVTVASPAETWLMADALLKDQPGPHSKTHKAFNYLRADGAVRFHQGPPRQVYE